MLARPSVSLVGLGNLTIEAVLRTCSEHCCIRNSKLAEPAGLTAPWQVHLHKTFQIERLCSSCSSSPGLHQSRTGRFYL